MKKQGRARLLLGGLLALGWLSGGTSADAQSIAPTKYPTVEQAGFRSPWRRAPDCPPVIITPAPHTVTPTPIDPKKSVDPKVDPKLDPKIDPRLDQPSALPPDAFSQLSPSGGGSAQTIAPNMFGDQFGSGGGRSRFILDRAVVIFDIDEEALPPSAGSPLRTGPITYNGSIVGQPGSALSFAGSPFPIPGGTLTGPVTFSVVSVETAQQLFNRANATSPSEFVLANIQNDPNVQAKAAAFLAARNNGAGTAEFDAGSSVAGTTSHPYSDLNDLADDFYDDAGLFYYYNYVTLVNVPNPAGGGVVGRVRVSEDSNPLPRDRFLFNYDYFSNVPLTANGMNVNRYSVGFEKTFFDGMTSIQVRLPFASTLDSDSTLGTSSRNTELGNLNIMFKALLWRSETIAVASGLGMSLPTADDTRVSFANGSDFVRIRNRTITLEPYFATLWTPTPRFFSQFWVSVPFDTYGNTVDANTDGRGLRRLGTLQDQTRLVLDGQVGYWIVRNDNNPERRIRGIAPFLELHYNTTTADADVVSSNGFFIGDLSGRVDEMNLTAGAVLQMRNNFLISIGAVAPLRTGDDQVFDYQIGVRANWFFGPTARDMNYATRSGSF